MKVTVNAKETQPAPLPHSKKMLQEPGYVPPTFPSMNVVNELLKKDDEPLHPIDDSTIEPVVHFTSPDGAEIHIPVQTEDTQHNSSVTDAMGAMTASTNSVAKSKSKGKAKNGSNINTGASLGVPTLSSTPASVLTPIKMETIYVDPTLVDVNQKGVSASGVVASSGVSTGVYKKRGRKPKGGKIIPMSSSGDANDREIPNIILHLRCFLSDLKHGNSISSFEYVPNIEDVVSYNSSDVTGSELKDIYASNTSGSITGGSDNDRDRVAPINCHTTLLRASLSVTEHAASVSNTRMSSSIQDDAVQVDNSRCMTSDIDEVIPAISMSNSSEFTVYSSSMLAPTNMIVGHHTSGCSGGGNGLQQPSSHHSHSQNVPEDVTQKEIWKKINQLKLTFHKSDMLHTKGTGRSACFWDTHDFDTPTIYIPMNIANNTYQVYGCFCSPECAVAYLMNENIDTSTKFERYHLINLLYGKICNYKKSIKPAPNPYYLLNKYYGNLSIQEYRKLFKSEQMIYVVNKPLTHILPELYEDNNDFLINSKVIPTNNLKMKKKYKSSILATTKE